LRGLQRQRRCIMLPRIRKWALLQCC
jgi:hypothetical protein